MNQFVILSFLLLVGKLTTIGQVDVLRHQIGELITNKKAITGVAILALEDGDTLTWNGAGHFPMQSVYKFHLALAVLDKVQNDSLRMNQGIFIKKSDLLPFTFSPLRDKYPKGEVNVPLKEIMKYTVSESDNNGCDILFRLLGGPQYVNTFIAGTGVPDISIKATEEQMHMDGSVQFTNWCTPWSAVQLLKKFYFKEILKEPQFGFLWQQLTETGTGKGRIKGLLPEGTVVAHKTGSSGSDTEGIVAATNDIGIICLPNGKHIAIAVFVSNSRENNETNEGLIASIALESWNYFLSRQHVK